MENIEFIVKRRRGRPPKRPQVETKKRKDLKPDERVAATLWNRKDPEDVMVKTTCVYCGWPIWSRDPHKEDLCEACLYAAVRGTK